MTDSASVDDAFTDFLEKKKKESARDAARHAPPPPRTHTRPWERARETAGTSALSALNPAATAAVRSIMVLFVVVVLVLVMFVIPFGRMLDALGGPRWAGELSDEAVERRRRQAWVAYWEAQNRSRNAPQGSDDTRWPPAGWERSGGEW